MESGGGMPNNNTTSTTTGDNHASPTPPSTTTCEATTHSADGWSIPKYRGRKSKDKLGCSGVVASNDINSKKSDNNHVDADDGWKSNHNPKYKGRRSNKDNKYGSRRNKSLGPEEPSPPPTQPPTQKDKSPTPTVVPQSEEKVPQVVAVTPTPLEQPPSSPAPVLVKESTPEVKPETPVPVVSATKRESKSPSVQEEEKLPIKKDVETPTASPPPPAFVDYRGIRNDKMEFVPKAAASPVSVEDPPHQTNDLENHRETSVESLQERESSQEVEEVKVSKPKEIKAEVAELLNDSSNRKYDRSFLLDLQNNPLSLKRPESLPNLEVVLNDPTQCNYSKNMETRYMSGLMNNNAADLLAPNYVKGTRGSKPNKSMVNNRPSYGGKNSMKMVLPMKIHNANFKVLTISDNAWRPNKSKDSNKDEDENATEVYRTMRGILNKLTPDNFQKLLGDAKALPISQHKERMEGVINLIFEKAVDEQSFSTTYAQLCYALTNSFTCKGNDLAKAQNNFRSLIIGKCQHEFEKDNNEENRDKWKEEMDAQTDPAKKQELKVAYEFEEMVARKRSVGNIRFIGELYKQKMLTSIIMMRIIETLLKKHDNESLECLCKLLSTIGSMLEQAAQTQPKALVDLNNQFGTMANLIGDKKTNSRVRFLMMDVVDLRKNNWQPRREESKPKTKAEVHNEINREENMRIIDLQNAPVRRNDGRNDRRGGRDSRPMADDGWTVQPSSRPNMEFSSNKIAKLQRHNQDSTNGNVLMKPQFGQWGRGSSGGTTSREEPPASTVTNRYEILSENQPEDGKKLPSQPLSHAGGSLRPGGSFASKSMPPPSTDEKENILSSVKQSFAPERSMSIQKSRDTSLNRVEAAPVSVLKGKSNLSEDEADNRTTSIIAEFCNIADFKEAKGCVIEVFSTKTICYFVDFAVQWVVDKDSKKRKLVGQLFQDLLKTNTITRKQFIDGLNTSLSMIEDFMIDIPQICEYYGEVFGPLLVDSVLNLTQMNELVQNATNKTATLLAWIINKAAIIVTEDKIGEMWATSKLDWATLVDDGVDVTEFLKKHKIEFVLNNPAPSTPSQSEEIKKPETDDLGSQLSELFKEQSNDRVMNWVLENIKDTQNKKFIRALVTAVVESVAKSSEHGSTIMVSDSVEAKLKEKLPVVVKYVDNSSELEMQVIYELQALSVRYQHPQGLLEKLFMAFYDAEIISEESFIEWEKKDNAEEQEGKGVCIKSLQSFLSWIKADEDQPT